MPDVNKEFLSPSLDEIRACAGAIDPYVVQTPVHQWRGALIQRHLGEDSELHLKLELFQRTGTFKARAAINNVLHMSDEERSRGIITVSAGNHAVATAYAAYCFKIKAKVIMLASASPARVLAAQQYGAEIVMADDAIAGFEMVEEIRSKEGLHVIHAFEGPNVTCATATCGLELVESLKQLDAVVVPIGGGGLCSGIAVAVKKLNPDCKVYGVEPVGAAVMTESLKSGAACQLDGQASIADSLMPPMTTPYAYAMCSQFVDEIVLVEDVQIAAAAVQLFSEVKLAVEAAAAATTAAAFGPLREELQGKRTALIICGTNTDLHTFSSLMEMGHEALGKCPA